MFTSIPRSLDPSTPRPLDPSTPRPLDPSTPRPLDPSTPRPLARAAGTAALLQVGGYDVLGTPSLALTEVNSTGWANGAGEPPATVVDTITDAEWAAIGPVDLSTVEISVGNDYSEASWSGTITIEYDVFEPAKITSFGPGAVVGERVANAADITWTLPFGTNLTSLAPTFTLSSGACDKANGGPTTYDFTSPVVYTVTDGPTVNTYTVTITTANALAWNVSGGGDWDTTTSNWTPLPSGSPTTFANGNEMIFDSTAGGAIVKEGGGTLTIQSNNSYDGGTTINGGTRRVDFPAQTSGLGSVWEKMGCFLDLGRHLEFC
jgi:autotransporter-associated beta strand protein